MKQEYDIRQTGDNSDFPETAITWKLGDPIPEWLSDRAKVKNLVNGEPELEMRDLQTGGVDILDSSGQDTLVRMKTKDSILIFSKTHPIISLTPHQLELLYR